MYGKETAYSAPTSSTGKKLQEVEVPTGHVKAFKYRYCRQTKVGTKIKFTQRLIVNFLKGKKKEDKDQNSMTLIAHHMCVNNLLLPIANIFLLDSGTNANFIYLIKLSGTVPIMSVSRDNTP